MEYQSFYLKHAVRKEAGLNSAVPELLEEFEFPKHSVMHYISVGTEFGPDSTQPLLYKSDNKIYVDHIADCTIVRGSAREVTFDLNKLSLQYHRRYLNFHKLRQVSAAASNKSNVIVANYAPITGRYRYRRTVFSIYDEYYNILSTALDSLSSREYHGPESNHWIPLEIPESLPDYESLKLNVDEVRRDDLADYNEMADVAILELYRFIMYHGSTDVKDDTPVSIFSKLDDEAMKRVNLIWLESGTWTWINLGDLAEWSSKGNRTELAKRLLNALNRLLEERTPVNFDTEGEEGITEAGSMEGLEEPSRETELTKPILDIANAAVEAGRMSGQEYKRMEKLAERYKTIPAPEGEGTLETFLEIPEEDLDVRAVKLPDMKSVVDKSMLESTLLGMEKNYINKVMQKDIANFAVSIQKAGFAVLDVRTTKHVDVANNNIEYAIKVQPADGSVSTIKFTIPRCSESGEMLTNGVKYRMALQPADLPIRKVLAERVALTSYYGKNFVTRSERTVNDYGAWLAKNITLAAQSSNSAYSDVHYGDYYVKTQVVPRVYSGIGRRLGSFTHNRFEYNFNFAKLEDFYKGGAEDYKRTGSIVIAKNKAGDLYKLDDTGMVYLQSKGKLTAVSMLEGILGIEGRPPVDMAELGIMGKTIPIGIVLGYHMGLTALLKKLKVRPRWVPRGKRVEHGDDEYIVVFKDETLILPRTDQLSSLILSGFNMYRSQIRDFNSHEMDKVESYRRLLNLAGLTAQRYGRELDLMKDMFIDHISLGLLKEMKEPTNMTDLYIRASELLMKDEHPEEVDPKFMRYRGYERLGGLAYGEFIKSIRQYRRTPGGKDKKLSMNPRAVDMAINTDASRILVEELSPVVETKQQELVTFSGTGGRSAQSMTAGARAYNKNNLGTISEAGVDSGKVGVNVATSSNPKFINARGRTAMYNPEEDTLTRIMSTSANLAPFSDRADGKRQVFIGIQQGSTMGSENYRAMPVSTGMDKIIAHRVTDKYAYKAPFDGKVVSVEDEYLTVLSADGKTEHVVFIGTQFGVVSGTYVPHRIRCDVKAGTKFKSGDVLAFNTAFFERCVFDTMQVQYKMGLIANTTFMESSDTLEDSSSIHKLLADKMAMDLTTLVTVDAGYDQSINAFVKVGTKVGVNDILCTITDEGESDGGRFDESSLEVLDGLSSVTPKSSLSGVVERIEAIYYGDKENMSESVRKLVNMSDKVFAERAKRTGDPNLPTSGQVNTSMRVGGTPLTENRVIFKVYITKTYKSGAGNKGVFSNQLKTVYGSVFTGNCRTLSGIPIHAKFAYQSVSNRILLDADIYGTSNMLLLVESSNVYKVYKGIKL